MIITTGRPEETHEALERDRQMHSVRPPLFFQEIALDREQRSRGKMNMASVDKTCGNASAR